jgi:hypothetical protein
MGPECGFGGVQTQSSCLDYLGLRHIKQNAISSRMPYQAEHHVKQNRGCWCIGLSLARDGIESTQRISALSAASALSGRIKVDTIFMYI